MRTALVALVALIGVLIAGCVFVSMMAMVDTVEDPPPTTFGTEPIVVPPPLDAPVKFPGNACTNIGTLGFEEAVSAMIESSVGLGRGADEAAADILKSIEIDCPEYEEQMRAR